MNYRLINQEVMLDTEQQCQTVPELMEAIQFSVQHQYMVAQEERIDQPAATVSHTKYIVSGKRSFEAAKYHTGKRVAVLNFANNHSIGGAPFWAGAQEESLCRCSTLYPCLQAMQEPFYTKHRRQYEAGEIDCMGTDDLIYTPDVVVFKTDERTNPIYPRMMAQQDWYKVNVITSAAPEMHRMAAIPSDYESRISSRVKKILDVATQEQNEVLILGAWGCGAFQNPTNVVASVFHALLQKYDFEIVEFALASTGDIRETPFAKRFCPQSYS